MFNRGVSAFAAHTVVDERSVVRVSATLENEADAMVAGNHPLENEATGFVVV